MTPPTAKGEMMDPIKKAKLEAAGFRSTTVTEFLGLTPEDEAWVEMKLALTRQLRESRHAAGATQAELAERIGSAQSRVAKMEGGSADTSFDLLIKGLLAAGASPSDIGKRLAGVPFKKPARKARRLAHA
jgi:hypothetical protein